ncbi:hypothetical protein F511_25311 [Dorcoceras hygrometricum]|uniref:Uncharacterized protein n=1 Tax=Dorcoceras hygrometricum TaxID=472368 RepID=A0A2Z7AE15_9LAMI|nr:hypothetical protein F511_25311 [Dorcoceras hygrometricum]
MGRSKSIVSLLNVDLRTLIITYNTTQFINLNLSSTRHRPLSSLAPPPPPPRAADAARLRRKIVSGRFDEENPFVQNSSVLLVQPDEGVSVLVVDRIGDYLPQSTEKSRVLVIPVGSRHKCQQEARQEGRTIDDVQTMRFNEFRKNILAQNASIFVGLEDVRKEVQEVNAKVDILASRVNDVQKDVEATKEAISHQLFEFQSQAQENHNILHAQLSELVDYIHQGRADKKGESGSRGLQQPSNVQIEASAERTPTFAQRVEIAQRHIVQTVLDADSNRELLERQAAAERDRERRRREARMLKRRRKY